MAAAVKRSTALFEALEAYKGSSKRFDAEIHRKLKILSIDQGNMRASFLVTPEMCNVGGFLQGGFMASVLDVAAVFSILHHPKGHWAWTTNVNMSFLLPACAGDMIMVSTEMLSMRKDLAAVECRFSNQRGQPIMHGYVGSKIPTLPKLFIDAFPFDPKDYEE